MKREDRGLAERADEHEHQRSVDHGAGRWIGQQRADARRLAHGDKHHDADEHHEPAERGRQQGLQRRAPAGRTQVVVTDEQVRQDARDLPEHHEHDDVVGEHEPIHGTGEGEQHTREPPDAVRLAAEVDEAIEHHERPDARDDQGHERAQRIHVHREADLQRTDPRPALGDDLSCRDRRQLQSGVREGCQREQRCDHEHPGPERLGEQSSEDRADPEGNEERQQRAAPLARPSRVVGMSSPVYRWVPGRMPSGVPHAVERASEAKTGRTPAMRPACWHGVSPSRCAPADAPSVPDPPPPGSVVGAAARASGRRRRIATRRRHPPQWCTAVRRPGVESDDRVSSSGNVLVEWQAFDGAARQKRCRSTPRPR